MERKSSASWARVGADSCWYDGVILARWKQHPRPQGRSRSGAVLLRLDYMYIPPLTPSTWPVT